MGNIVEALRHIILNADAEPGGEVKWNASAFFYTRPMLPFNPKEYKRHLIIFNLFKQDCIRPVFPSGAKVDDGSGFLTGDYADGRRLALFYGIEDVERRKVDLQRVIKTWLELLEK